MEIYGTTRFGLALAAQRRGLAGQTLKACPLRCKARPNSYPPGKALSSIFEYSLKYSNSGLVASTSPSPANLATPSSQEPSPSAEEPLCQVNQTNPHRVAAAKEAALPEASLEGLSSTFKVLGDPTRLKLLWALAGQELCVCDLAEVVGLSVSAVSHQLRLLRDRRLVNYRREGQLVYYQLADHHIPTLIELARSHVEEPP